MRRVLIPGLLAIAMIASSSVSAQAGLFDHLCGGGCDSCDAVCEPACGFEVAPTCGCEPEPCCGGHKHGLLHKLFHRGDDCCCDTGCDIVEPVCGCEVAEPVCGCEMIEPACGCEPACDSHCGGPKFGGFFRKLFKGHGHSNGCCEVEPVCGCEPACGFEVGSACGCGL